MLESEKKEKAFKLLSFKAFFWCGLLDSNQ